LEVHGHEKFWIGMLRPARGERGKATFRCQFQHKMPILAPYSGPIRSDIALWLHSLLFGILLNHLCKFQPSST